MKQKRCCLFFDVAESEAQLSVLMQKEDTLRGKQRIRMLLLYVRKSARSCSELSRLVGVERRTIKEWVDLYQKKGLNELLERGRDHQAKRQQSQLTPQMREELLVYNSDPDTAFRTYKEAWQWLKDKFGITLSYERTYEILHDQMKLRLRVPRPFHIKKDEQASVDFKKSSR